MRVSARLIVISCLVFPTLGGCGSRINMPFVGNGSGSTAGAVAVIDLDAIAKALGRDKQMSDSLQRCEASLNQQLGNIKASYEKQLSDKQAEIGATPTREQAEMLVNTQRQANANLNQVLRQAKNNLSQHSAQLIQAFREEVKPVARQVACERGLSIIVTKNDSVIFDYDRAVDITEPVINRMLALQMNQARLAQPLPPASASSTTPTARRESAAGTSQ